MAKNKFGIEKFIFDEYAEKLRSLEGDLQKATDEALTKSAEYVTKNLKKDIASHRRSGDTEKSLIDKPKVEWEGSQKASIDVGFDISNDGLPSIFLMRGAKPHGPYGKPKPNGKGGQGHPGIKQDKELFNDVYGTKTKKKIQEIQEEVFAKAIEKAMEKKS